MWEEEEGGGRGEKYGEKRGKRWGSCGGSCRQLGTVKEKEEAGSGVGGRHNGRMETEVEEEEKARRRKVGGREIWREREEEREDGRR